jgi:uncharacterized protein
MKITPLKLCVVFILFQQCSKDQPESHNSVSTNPVTWFSIPSDDLNRTSTFYKSAFGWEIQPLTIEKNDVFSYHNILTSESDDNLMPTQNGTVNGCIVKRKIGLPTPAVLVEVDDLNTAILRVQEAGGIVMTDKIDMPTLNAQMVLIKDTEGNYVEVFQTLSTKNNN